MAIKIILWVPVQVNWDILENSLLNKSFSEYQPLSFLSNLIFLSQYWSSVISQAMLNVSINSEWYISNMWYGITLETIWSRKDYYCSITGTCPAGTTQSLSRSSRTSKPGIAVADSYIYYYYYSPQGALIFNCLYLLKPLELESWNFHRLCPIT